jgi:uncharacterized membrane protein
MASPTGRWTDERLEITISAILRIGIVAAASLVFVAGGLYLMRHGREKPHYRVFHGEPGDLCDIEGIVGAAGTLESRRAVIQLGLVVLILVPVARVAFSVAAFAKQRDLLYVIVTLIVLAVLLHNLLGGLARPG